MQFRPALAACALLGATTLAPAQDFQDAQTLQFTGNPEFRSAFVDGVKSWIYALENARRAMQVQRCTALDASYPKTISPRIVAAANAANSWLTGTPAQGLGPFEQRIATREASALAVRIAFNAADLQAWNTFRNSEAGRRGLAVLAMAQSLDLVEEYLAEPSTGAAWDWPLARIRRLADSLGLRAAFDTAMNDVEAGTAQRVAQMADVPGLSANEALVARIAKASESGDLTRAFLEAVSAGDRAAFQQLQAQPQYVRWNQVFEPLGEYLSGGLPDRVRGGQPPMATEAFCTQAGIAGCGAGTPLRMQLEQARAKWSASIMNDQVVTAVSQIVRRLPEAGCPT